MSGQLAYDRQWAGASDELILQQAGQTDSIGITTDKDLGELVFRQPSVTGDGTPVNTLWGEIAW